VGDCLGSSDFLGSGDFLDTASEFLSSAGVGDFLD